VKGQVTFVFIKLGQLNEAVASAKRDVLDVELAAEKKSPAKIVLMVGTAFGKLIET
jgi:hypothetical protein